MTDIYTPLSAGYAAAAAALRDDGSC